MARIFIIETDDEKAVRIVTFHVVDRNVPGRTQVFCQQITKIVMLVGKNDFDSYIEDPKLNVQDESYLGGSR